MRTEKRQANSGKVTSRALSKMQVASIYSSLNLSKIMFSSLSFVFFFLSKKVSFSESVKTNTNSLHNGRVQLRDIFLSP